jgi:peptidoglycan/LPS O-acetylase OafA/YrhL
MPIPGLLDEDRARARPASPPAFRPVPEAFPQPGPSAQPEEPAWLWRGQVPSLNGLRGISILLVLLSHLERQGTLISRRFWYVGELGHVGVDMFFVISGFLITLLLIRERGRTGSVSIKEFYVRRAFRILPAYTVFLLGLLGLSLLGHAQLRGSDWLGALTYTVSFLPQPSWEVGHIWSLSVEEHFYLVWPLVFWLWPRRAWVVACAYLAVTPGLRLLIHDAWTDLSVQHCTLTRVDTIAVGCCLAFLAASPSARRRLRLSAVPALLVGVGLLAALLVSQVVALRSAEYDLLVHPPLSALCFAGLIWIGINHGQTRLGRLLNSRPLVVLGLLSYSIYLWQQPVLNPRGASALCRWPFNLGFIALCAAGSYLLIESPLLRLKERLRSGVG